MCRPVSVNSFDALGGLLKNLDIADADSFSLLASPDTKPSVRSKERLDLERTVRASLDRMDDMTRSSGMFYGIDCGDYCRNFAAYLIEFGRDGEYRDRAFSAIIDILEYAADPRFRNRLREMRRTFASEDSRIGALGFGWDDLKIPFDKDRFCSVFIKTEVTIVPRQKIVYVEKEVEKVVEKEVIKVVEKEKVVEKIVEVGPKEDPNYFGVEDQNTEFKASFFISEKIGDNQVLNVCKEICAFLNADGGVIYIGVDDETHRAFPKMMGTFPAGVNKEILYLGKRLPFGKNSVDSYCIAVKHRIEQEFRNDNDTSKFMNDVRVTEVSKNDNVIRIEIRPSRYAVVRLAGTAWQRSGSEAKRMDDTQIRQREQDLHAVSKTVEFREELKRAIREKKQVMLYSYESANSRTIKNRYIEPVNFVCSDESIISFDVDEMETRQFKLSRIGDIKVLDRSWQYENLHEARKTDIFGWTDEGMRFNVCLDMNLTARRAMMESYPNVNRSSFTKVSDDTWRMETELYSLDAVRGFYLGFADSIEIRESDDSEKLKCHIRKYIQESVLPKLN